MLSLMHHVIKILDQPKYSDFPNVLYVMHFVYVYQFNAYFT